MKKILAILLAATLMFGLLSACGKAPAEKIETQTEAAAETAQQTADAEKAPEEQPALDDAAVQEAFNRLTISVVSPTVEAGTERAAVPVKIFANKGLAGALVTVQYDEALKLTDVKAGDAFGTLTFTPGGDLSANPYNMLWDGQNEDASNGDIAFLTFDLPSEPGEYKIALGGDPKNFYDDEMNDVPVFFASGSITVTAKA